MSTTADVLPGWATGLWPAPEGVVEASAADQSLRRLSFAPMTAAQIRAYVASGEPMGKAGAYGVQGRAAAHIELIQGSYSGIMGLPLFETAQLLRQLGMRC